MNYICRKIVVSDIDEFYRLRLEGLEKFPRFFWETPHEFTSKGVEFQKQRLGKQSDDGRNSFIIGAFDGDRLLGICGCKLEDGIKGYHRALIWGMYVSADSHGKGIGGAVLDTAIDEACKMEGLECLFLFVAADNLPAARLYHSRGFRSYGLEPMSLKDNGEFVREFMMIKKL